MANRKRLARHDSLKVITHPTTQRQRIAAFRRYSALKREHSVACNRMWAGTIAANFTASEMHLISDVTCDRDRILLHLMRNEGSFSEIFPLTPMANTEGGE